MKCIQDEIPFDLPDGWVWCYLPQIAQSELGKTLDKAKNTGEYHPYIRSVNVLWGKLDLSDLKQMRFENSELDKYAIRKNDLLICEGGDVGRCCIWDKDYSILYQNAIHRVRFYNDINPEFYMYVLMLYEHKGILKRISNGVTIKHLTGKVLSRLPIPLPSLHDQNNIVQIIKFMLSQIDSIETIYNELSIDISIIKSKILDLAIRGKLVPQNPDDEPASVLLERIRAEKEELIKQGKIKRDKKESVIFKGDDNSYYEKFMNNSLKCIDEEVPFDLPLSWQWCRLGVVFSHNTGKALNSADVEGALLPYITTSNLYWDRFELNNLKKMPFTESEIDKCTVIKGDLLVCEGGDIGRAAIWEYDEEIRIQNHIHKLRPYINLSNRFYFYVFYFWKQLGFIGGNGIGLQGFSSKAIHNLIIPIPPINEQYNIVKTIDNLFNILNSIEKSLS